MFLISVVNLWIKIRCSMIYNQEINTKLILRLTLSYLTKSDDLGIYLMIVPGLNSYL